MFEFERRSLDAAIVAHCKWLEAQGVELRGKPEEIEALTVLSVISQNRLFSFPRGGYHRLQRARSLRQRSERNVGPWTRSLRFRQRDRERRARRPPSQQVDVVLNSLRRLCAWRTRDRLGASPDGVAYIRRRLAERVGSHSRDMAVELAEHAPRLQRVEEGIRGLILMQAEGDRSTMVAQMRSDLEAQAQAERSAMEDIRDQADAPIRLPPADLIRERVLALRALTESSDVDGARAALRRYLKGGEITLTPELFGDGQAYTARAEFLPLVLLTENAATPSEGDQGGRCLRVDARGGFEPPTFGL